MGLADFTCLLAEANGLDIAQWLFEPGMRHGDSLAWWGRKSPRRQVHHGLDFIRYKSSKGETGQLLAGMLVPLPAAGTIIGIIDDFLGQTVICTHGEFRERLLTGLYGHIKPIERISGKPLEAGSIIAELAYPGKGAVPAHLHMGLALLPMGTGAESLSWDYLNTASEVEHLDPLEFMR